jgi:hypothetical protein
MSFLDIVSLPKTSTKMHCPGCSKKTFKPYVWTDSGQPVDATKYGRCDRVNECTYDTKPSPEMIREHTGDNSKPKTVKTILTIFPNEDVLKKLHRKPSNLHKHLHTKLGIPFDFMYDQGMLTTEDGLTAYVFRNVNKKLCNIKYFKYNEDGHRDKNFASFSLKQPEQRSAIVEERYTVPLFGEQFLDPEKRKIACVVESEKSRVIAAWCLPNHDWVGCGSANGLSDGTNDTADKITPLKGRTTYWVCDNDKAARGKFINNEKDEAEWQDCSSIRNGKKHIQDFHICDLFEDKEPGYDIGDALLDGLKPDVVPTTVRAYTDKRFMSYMAPDINRMRNEYQGALQIGETTGISEDFDSVYSWMRTHVNGWYGWSNDGKGTMLDFVSVVKSIVNDDFKHCFFKQEDLGSYFMGKGKGSVITADRIYAKLVWTKTGITPFAHYSKKHNTRLLEWDAYVEAYNWVKKHFFIINPADRRYKNIRDEFMFYAEVFGVSHFGIDPFNTVILDDNKRGDERLVSALTEYKDLALKTNSVVSIVNHAGSKHEVRDKNNAFKVVTQFMQLGGSGWDMKMDGQFSIHRPRRHKKANDPVVNFWNLKQRDSEIVGAERGVFKSIEFDRNKRQYYFDGVNPISGDKRLPVVDQQQSEIEYTPTWLKDKKKKNSKSYEDHVRQDWAISEPDWVTDSIKR